MCLDNLLLFLTSIVIYETLVGYTTSPLLSIDLIVAKNKSQIKTMRKYFFILLSFSTFFLLLANEQHLCYE